MGVIGSLVDIAILAAVALLWARWSKLDLGLSAPAYGKAEPWALLAILWCIAIWVIPIYLPVYVDPDFPERMDQISFAGALIADGLLTPVAEELFFRGAMFAALLRRWGIGAAALVPSLVWGLLHIQYEWWVVVSIIVWGILLAMVRWRSGSLYLPIGLHAAWNLLVTLDAYGLLGSAA